MKKVCGEGHYFQNINEEFCPICRKKGIAMSLYVDDTYTRSQLPGVFGMEESQRCANLFSQGILEI
jgi:hypothetical protein